jgi:hypothetical protein
MMTKDNARMVNGSFAPFDSGIQQCGEVLYEECVASGSSLMMNGDVVGLGLGAFMFSMSSFLDFPGRWVWEAPEVAPRK